jgi:hypothetical protein
MGGGSEMEKETRKKTLRIKLTKRVIGAVEPPENGGGQAFLWDIALQRFGLHVTRGTTRAVVMRQALPH